MDSDAILQAVALGMPNIFVVRKDSPMNPTVVVSIDNFMRSLEETFPGEANRARLDFCAICLFRGNDYLRGMAAGLEQLWRAYLFTRLVDPAIKERGNKTFLIDTEKKTFDLFFLRRLILNSFKPADNLKLPSKIEQMEQKRARESTVASKKQPHPEDNGGYGNESDMDSADEQEGSELTDTTGDQETEEPSDLAEEAEEDEGEEEDNANEMRAERRAGKAYSVQRYLEGILWNLDMYCSGKCPDVGFTYGFQYGPSRRAIVAYVDEMSQTEACQSLAPGATSKLLGVMNSDQTFANPLVCALIVSVQWLVDIGLDGFLPAY